MANLQSITNRLQQINETVFQELCDSLLIIRNPNYRSFSRSGSVSSKQKTKRGTPDSFLLLENGRYLFMEATTKDKGLLEKLKSDIDSCFTSSKSGIDSELIEEVVLCFNSDLSGSETEVLRKQVETYNRFTKLSLYGLSRLATEINLHHKNLAREYLGLPLDTGQIVSLKEFIKIYNNSGQRIATPIDNVFMHRHSELESLNELLKNEDLILIAGAPGVGKTKLALELIEQFLNRNTEFVSYAIVNRNTDLIEDLDQQVLPHPNVIIFIDDINRIDRFSQVISFYEHSSIKLKIVATVRDYALNELTDLLGAIAYKSYHLEKFSDDEIKEIIENRPFEITNTICHNKIFEIADGNPRLAIMLALLAIEKQSIDALNDTYHLFDSYFSTFIKDKDLFKDKVNLKTLALVAFFHTIPYNDDEVVKRFLNLFDLNRNEFIQSVEKLRDLELVETRYDHVKIAEQNLGIYFFYKVFLEQELLPFIILLDEYFISMPSRFRDTIIPVNNTFGYQNVRNKLQEDLKSFWKRVAKKEVDAFLFLDHFWFYIQQESISYLYDLVMQLPESEKVVFVINNDRVDTHNEDKFIKLFGEFMRGDQYLEEVLELSFLYIKRRPEKLTELIRKVEGRFSIDYEDEDYGFPRHSVLLSFFENRLNNEDDVIKRSFIEISKNLLKYHFQHYKNARGNAITIYRYPLQLSDETKKLRERIWLTLEKLFVQFPEDCFGVLMKHLNERLDFNKEIFRFDLNLIIWIVNDQFDVNSYKHCHYIHEIIRWSNKHEIDLPVFSEWKQIFSGEAYRWFKMVDWNQLRDKEEYEFDNWKEFEELKERDIRVSLKFNSKDEFYKFLNFVHDCLQWDQFINKSRVIDTLDIVLEECLSDDSEICFIFLKPIFEEERFRKYYIYRTIRKAARITKLREKFWDQLCILGARGLVKLEFLSCLPQECLNGKHLERLYKTYDELEEGYFLSFKSLEGFLRLDNMLYDNLLRRVLDLSESKGLDFSLDFNFFKDISSNIKDTALLKQAYIYFQENSNRTNYDHDGSQLSIVLDRAPEFFMEYSEQLFDIEYGYPSYREHRELVAVWDQPNSTELIDNTMEIVLKKDPFPYIGGHFMNAFFKDLRNNKEKAEEYLRGFVERNYMNWQKISILIEIVFNSFKSLYDQTVIKFLALNQDIEAFKNIKWLPNEGVLTGKVNWGDREAARWINLKRIIEQANLGLKLIEHKKYVSGRIQEAKKHGEAERRRKYLENFD